MNWQPVRVFGDVARFVDVADIELRVYALSEQVLRQSDHVIVASALAVAKEGPFNAVGSSEHAEFRGGDAGSSIVVRMQ